MGVGVSILKLLRDASGAKLRKAAFLVYLLNVIKGYPSNLTIVCVLSLYAGMCLTLFRNDFETEV
jgi:hypothetical protein